MGIAAYNRGTNRIRRQLDAEARPVEFDMMDALNRLAKFPDAGRPFGRIEFVRERGLVWAQCPIKRAAGTAFAFSNLYDAVRSFQVEIVAYDNGAWIAKPIQRAT